MHNQHNIEATLSRHRMITRQDVAEIFSVTSDQVPKLVKSGVIPAPVTFAGYLERWPACWIIEVLEKLQQRQPAASDKENRA